MSGPSHRFVLEILKEGALLAETAVPPASFDPALEWVHFSAIRRGLLPPRMISRPAGSVTPIWDPSLGEPHVGGFRAAVPTPGGGVFSRDIPVSFFRRLARAASRPLVAAGKLERGDFYRFRVSAFPGDVPPASPPEGLAMRDLEPPLPFDDLPLGALLAAAASRGEPREGEIPVFIPDRVLAEAEALKREAGEVETGGVLIGHLHRDAAIPDLFLEVTAQIPARHARASAARLTFTAETWSAVRGAIEVRRKGEVMCGWWHTHPARHWKCKECEPSVRTRCGLAGSFFSEDDLCFHDSVFPRSFGIALVLGDEPTPDGGWADVRSLYGRHLGMVMERGFHVLGDGRTPAAETGTTIDRKEARRPECPGRESPRSCSARS